MRVTYGDLDILLPGTHGAGNSVLVANFNPGET